MRDWHSSHAGLLQRGCILRFQRQRIWVPFRNLPQNGKRAVSRQAPRQRDIQRLPVILLQHAGASVFLAIATSICYTFNGPPICGETNKKATARLDDNCSDLFLRPGMPQMGCAAKRQGSLADLQANWRQIFLRLRQVTAVSGRERRCKDDSRGNF